MKNLIIVVVFSALSVISFAEENIQDQNAKNCNSFCQSKEACANLITENITMNWSRPPMKGSQSSQVTLKISLFPNGSIKSVLIETGSGHENLDNSVLQAVKRASNFCEIQGLTPEVYENNFKEFIVVFNTQDSRN